MLFDEVLGQENAVSYLKALLETDRLSGSYFFAGPEGVGKALCARQFAKALLGEANPIAAPPSL